MSKRLVFLIFVLLSGGVFGPISASGTSPSIEYRVAMSHPNSHYFEVTVRVRNFRKSFVDFHMPVWIPGSYLVREFEKNVVLPEAEDGAGRPLKVRKIRKNIWRVWSRKAKNVIFRYKVYAYVISVRNSFLDDSHGFVNPSSVCVFVPQLKNRPLRLQIEPLAKWRVVSTGLKRSPEDSLTFFARNYDELVDCPIEVGNQKVLRFRVRGVPHEISIYGTAHFDPDSVVAGFKKVVETEVGIMRDIDYPRYVFLVQLEQHGGGGLEHRNSCVLQMGRHALERKNLRHSLGLVFHEYFHNWNVKRLRPKALGPFDYDRENYTWLLWVAEGFTSYYSGRAQLLSGVTKPESYFKGVPGWIETLESRPGKKVQPVDLASFDAWIKYYRPDENSVNTSISYYGKGAVLAQLLDLTIRHETKNRQSLDDLMRGLYQKYYKKHNRWYTPQEFQTACEKLAGRSLQHFFASYVSGTDSIDYSRFYRYAGVELVQKPLTRADSLEGYAGFKVSPKSNAAVVSEVLSGSPAEKAGIYVNDEILAVNGFRTTRTSLLNTLHAIPPGQKAAILLSRRGLIKTVTLTLGRKPNFHYELKKVAHPDSLQKAIFESYFRMKWN